MDQIHISIVARRAQQASTNIGFSWGILNSSNELVHIDSGIPGYEKEKIVADINRYKSSISTLILSIEPHDFYVEIIDLCLALDMSNCGEIFIIHQLDIEDRSDQWFSWSQSWKGKINLNRHAILPTRLNLALKKYSRSMQPWITAICSAGLDGSYIGLEAVASELGFSTTFLPIIKNQKALIFDEKQKTLIEIISNDKYACDKPRFLIVKSAQEFSHIIDNLYETLVFESLLFCSPSFLAGIEHMNCIDEVHIYLSTLKFGERDEKIKLENYKVISSELFGDFIRLTCIRKTHYRTISSLLTADFH